MTLTSDYEDIDELDEPETFDAAEPAAATAEPPGSPGWEWTPKRKKLAAVAAGLVALVVVGRSCGGDEEKAAAPVPTATTMTVNPLDGFPTPSPLVASTLRAEDVGEFANKVHTALADRTSICDVYYGVVTRQLADGTREVRWSITTPAMQARSEVGVQLPSSKWPVRAFYGAPCNVVNDDVPLVTTTTTAPAVKAG